MAGGFSLLDIILGLLVVAAAVRGAVRGFVAELGSVAALGLGVWGSLRFSQALLPALERSLGRTIWSRVVAFLIVFLAIYIAVKLVELGLQRLFSGPELSRLDQVLGFFLGAGEGVLAAVLILYLLRWQPLFDTRQLLQGSLFARLLLPLFFPAGPGSPAPSAAWPGAFFPYV